MNHHKYLILVEIDDSPFLVLADDEPPTDGFVAFDDGTGEQIGKIVNSDFINSARNTYKMFSALRPIFEAVKMYGCCYEKEAGDG
jgi:hypothetical protein